MKYLLFFIPLVLSLEVYSHGENTLGPNKGYIRMPGSFHTELVKKKNKLLEVYLLDLSFKNPMIEKSDVILTLEGRKNDDTVNCLPKKDKLNFECMLPEEISKYKRIKIKSIRNGVKANKESEYELPLKLN